jgi:hypothetical protein
VDTRSSGGAVRLLRHVASLIGFAIVSLALVLAAGIGLVRAGLVENPFAPHASGDLALARGDRHGLRVLFVGNSFTFENSMPGLVHQLAAADVGATPV